MYESFSYTPPKRSEALKEGQPGLRLRELEIAKPTDTRRASNERCIRVRKKEHPAILLHFHSFQILPVV